MDIKIQSLKFDASKQLIEFIEKKMSRLERFAENPTGVDVVLRLEKDDEKGNKVALVTLHVAGGDILTEQRARTFEEAIDNALDVVKRQIEKRKDKQLKRGCPRFWTPSFYMYCSVKDYSSTTPPSAIWNAEVARSSVFWSRPRRKR